MYKRVLIVACWLVVGGMALAGCGSSNAAAVTGQQVVDSFKKAGLEAENVRPFDVEEIRKAPTAKYDGTRFFTPSLCPDCGGRIFVAASEKDRDAIFSYYDTLSKAGKTFFSWVFRSGDVVVQINGDLPEEKARKYEAALKDTVK